MVPDCRLLGVRDGVTDAAGLGLADGSSGLFSPMDFLVNPFDAQGS